ncbi:MAG: protein kinase [Planctomycetota bacterium]|nr:protein kinase [Planctomycetota bacterium]
MIENEPVDTPAEKEPGKTPELPSSGQDETLPMADVPGDESTIDLRTSIAATGRVGPYKILQALGVGGMGVVYLAEQTEPVHRLVALKLIKLGMDTEEVVARFESERQALALMNHPNIAKVYDAGATVAGRPYFVMDYSPGEAITQFCDNHRLPTRERLEIFMQVCDAVQHAHQKGIIHRDIKPSNILVTLVNDKPVPKIIDFGVARATNQRLTERTLFTEQGRIIGTPEYMSPEQAESSSLDIDTRTDIYSLGVVLYALLVGTLPFDSKKMREEGLEAIRHKIRGEDPPKPSTRVTRHDEDSSVVAEHRRTDPASLHRLLRGDLDWITMKAMDKDRTRRYATASELAADIGRHLRNEPVLAGPPGAGYRLKKYVARNRVGVAAGGAVVLALVAGLLTTSWMARVADRERNTALDARADAEGARRTAELERDRALIAQEREVRAREVAERITRFLQDMLASVDPTQRNRHDITVREVLDASAQTVEAELAEYPEVHAGILHTIGVTYAALGLFPSAESHLREALTLRRGVLGESHLDVATTLHALSYKVLPFLSPPRFDEALRKCRQVVAIRRKLIGEGDDLTINTLGDLAHLFQMAGDNKAARGLLIESLVAYHGGKKTKEEVDRELVKGMDALGALWSVGNHEMASKFIRAYCAPFLKSRYWDEKLPAVLTAIAQHQIEIDNPDSAEALLSEAVKIGREILGDEYPVTLSAIHALARLLSAREKRQAAEALFLEALAGRRRVLTDDHPHTRQTADGLIELYESWGRPEKAEEVRGWFNTQPEAREDE